MGSRALVVVWSKTSVKSEWVHHEAVRGLEKNALVPIMLNVKAPPARIDTVRPGYDPRFLDAKRPITLPGVTGPATVLRYLHFTVGASDRIQRPGVFGKRRADDSGSVADDGSDSTSGVSMFRVPLSSLERLANLRFPDSLRRASPL